MTWQKKHWLVALISVVMVVAVIVVSLQWSRKNVSQLAQRHNSTIVPLIMIPGSSATENRFDSLVKALNVNRRNPHSLLKIRVAKSDQLTFSGQIRPRDHAPIVVVGFENNHDGYSNIKNQARQFNIAFKALNERLSFSRFEVVGHSNGGLIFTVFLEKDYAQYAPEIQVTKLMTIGSPFNFNERNINNKTQMLSDFIKNRKKLPTNLNVYSVAGTQNYTSDGIVPLTSVMASRYIFQGQVKHFTTMTVSGSDAQHSDLPQNHQIVNLINHYMLTAKRRHLVQPNEPELH
ncbi:alpha/beta hydrolase [Lentilactobacillus kisonensis]|uniref:Uncharacterized protein n=2 Tax=Lentilactobacillus kisonensis TaxID=481722 RepID=H1LHI8_9LACO|nr:alpha/beta hydrolase [Lentilactobacillus kisonensis]EHO50314.1 hypothetical protein HMPREF9104_02079 [Lentilactobacillus kisonensis F0435]KRL21250.1 hypothetical protein FC98_GL000840 [Lentilactobacillus kisonensis DSM 19906 = JCM 15041]